MFCYVVSILFRIADHPANQHLASPASTHPNYNTGTFTRPKKKPLIVSSHIPASNIDNDSDLEAELPALNSDHESDDDAPVMKVNIQPPTPTVQEPAAAGADVDLGVHMGIDETTKFVKSESLHIKMVIVSSADGVDLDKNKKKWPKTSKHSEKKASRLQKPSPKISSKVHLASVTKPKMPPKISPRTSPKQPRTSKRQPRTSPKQPRVLPKTSEMRSKTPPKTSGAKSSKAPRM